MLTRLPTKGQLFKRYKEFPSNFNNLHIHLYSGTITLSHTIMSSKIKAKTEQCLFNLCSKKYSSIIKPLKQPELCLCSLLSNKSRMEKHGDTEGTDGCEPKRKKKLMISNTSFTSTNRTIFPNKEKYYKIKILPHSLTTMTPPFN